MQYCVLKKLCIYTEILNGLLNTKSLYHMRLCVECLEDALQAIGRAKGAIGYRREVKGEERQRSCSVGCTV